VEREESWGIGKIEEEGRRGGERREQGGIGRTKL